MLFLIQGVQQNLNVTSHILEGNRENPDMLRLFHCWECGGVVGQFAAEIGFSTPGGVFGPLPLLQMCRKCKRRHLFNSIL